MAEIFGGYEKVNPMKMTNAVDTLDQSQRMGLNGNQAASNIGGGSQGSGGGGDSSSNGCCDWFCSLFS